MSATERNFILKIPLEIQNSKEFEIKNDSELSNFKSSFSNKTSIVCLEDLIKFQLQPHKSSFINLHLISLRPCTSWIQKFELYDIDLNAWVNLVNVLKIMSV